MTWPCPHCTFVNLDLNLICEMCAKSRHKGFRDPQFDKNIQAQCKHSAEDQNNETLAEELRQEGNDKTKSWRCSHCTFVNSYLLTICEMCAKSNRKDFKQNAEGQHDESFVQKLQREKNNETKSWYCPYCTFLNSDLNLVCELCEMSKNKDFKHPQIDEILQVQRQQSTKEKKDKAVAQKLQIEENEEVEERDKALARFLQQEENNLFKTADPLQEHQEMIKNTTGRAFLLVKRIVELANNLKSHQHFSHLVHTCSIENVAVDDLVFLSERLLTQQEEFAVGQNTIMMGTNGAAATASLPIPTHIDVCYHYTNSENMHHIRTNGLMSKQERINQNITSSSNGASFGDGIYTANNPTSFSSYGTVGLIVSRLLGKTVKVPKSLSSNQKTPGITSANTIIGDKTANQNSWPSTDRKHEFVSQKSSQCLPMLKFDKNLLQQSDGERCIKYLHNELQQLLDELCNANVKKPSTHAVHNSKSNLSKKDSSISMCGHQIVPRNSSNANHNVQSTIHNSAPSFPRYQRPRQNISLNITSSSSATPSFPSNQIVAPCSLQYNAPHSFTQNIPAMACIPSPLHLAPSKDCVICMMPLKSSLPIISLQICNHFFHKKCIEKCLEMKPQCPICRKALSEPQGKSPSGSMTISSTTTQCSGYNYGSIVIDYKILAGTQKSYHDNPGVAHGSKKERAYLPNNKDGQQLLKRLKYAFMKGLSFTVGTSATTGTVNQCIWSSIHHKTSQNGGLSRHGFPDPLYFMNCNEELDGLGVPKAHLLNDSGDLL